MTSCTRSRARDACLCACLCVTACKNDTKYTHIHTWTNITKQAISAIELVIEAALSSHFLFVVRSKTETSTLTHASVSAPFTCSFASKEKSHAAFPRHGQPNNSNIHINLKQRPLIQELGHQM